MHRAVNGRSSEGSRSTLALTFQPPLGVEHSILRSDQHNAEDILKRMLFEMCDGCASARSDGGCASQYAF